MMWASDYPHAACTWPHSQETIGRQFQGVPADEVRKIVCDNAVEIFAFN